ncbi:hypothetical protein [Polaromonas sp. JS666]|uniref:hypothetical protein n=1 Tax=Polaromonas sp. (strain JS666 / ATCC BAA-500) TaxID=296591 RepID=UPI0012EDE537|nr:hypothetical protein [Polaromonas sp. JS666]
MITANPRIRSMVRVGYKEVKKNTSANFALARNRRALSSEFLFRASHSQLHKKRPTLLVP